PRLCLLLSPHTLGPPRISCRSAVSVAPPPRFFSLSLHDALPISRNLRFLLRLVHLNLPTGHLPSRRIHPRPFQAVQMRHFQVEKNRKSTRLNSSHVSNSYAVFCLKNNIIISSTMSSKIIL